MLRHELREVLGRVAAGSVLLEQPVEIAHHVPHARQVLGRDPLDPLAQTLEGRLEQLLAQLVGERAEVVARGVVHEFVVAQAAQLARYVLRQRVEAVAVPLCRAPQHLLREACRVLLLARCRIHGTPLSGVEPPLDPASLAGDDPVEALGDLVHDAAEVRTLELLLALAAQPVEDPPQPGDVAAAGALEATLHEAPQRATHVALGEDVVGQGIQDVVGVEGRQALGAVPAGVAVEAHLRALQRA